MKCPFCGGSELKVNDSREAPEMNAIRRRRECLHCLQRFTTFESIELTMQVLKRDGRYEDFDKQKLINGLQAACRHTTISHDQVIALASKITCDLLRRQARVICTTELGEIVMDHLKELDSIAYIRFACVYRRFKDIRELMEAIHSTHPTENQSLAQLEESYHATKKK
jgi:transcriptional repressor NrdR